MIRTWLSAGMFASLLGASSLGAAEPSQAEADSKPVQVAQGRPGSYGFPRWDSNFGGYDRSRRTEEEKPAKDKDRKPEGPPSGGGPGFGPWGKGFGPPFMRGPGGPGGFGGFGGPGKEGPKDGPKGPPPSAEKKGPPPGGKGPPWMRPADKKEEPRSQAKAPEKKGPPEKKAPPWAQKEPSRSWRGGPPMAGRPGFGPWAKFGHGGPPWARQHGSSAFAHRFGHPGFHGHHAFGHHHAKGHPSHGRGPVGAHHGPHGKAKGHVFHRGPSFGRGGPAWGHHTFHARVKGPSWTHHGSHGHKCHGSHGKAGHGRGGPPWAHHHQGFRAAPPWAHSGRGGFHGARGPSRGPSWTGYRGYGHPGFGGFGHGFGYGHGGFGYGHGSSFRGYHHGPAWHQRGR